MNIQHNKVIKITTAAYELIDKIIPDVLSVSLYCINSQSDHTGKPFIFLIQLMVEGLRLHFEHKQSTKMYEVGVLLKSLVIK